MGYVALLFGLLIALIFFGFPIYLSICISSLVLVWLLDYPLSLVIIKIFGGIDSFSLMAIPFFILAGNIMMESKITDRIVDFSDALVGRFKGGLGHVNILSSMFFAGIQGSGVADASAIGMVMIPPMVKQGYDRDYAVAVTASSSTIGPIIPPSIAMIMFAYYTELSVGKLFLGGLIPGILIGVGLMLVNAVMFRWRGYQFQSRKHTVKEIFITGFRSIGALMMPFIIIFGIISGVFTPTESGIAATVYGLVYGLLISRQLKLRRLPKVIIDAANTTAVVMIILAMAGIFSNILTRLRFQQLLIQHVILAIPDKYLATLTIMGLLILLGLFIDPAVLIVMFASTIYAAGNVLGFDPIHFGVLMVITMLMGAVTPPVGSMLFISCSIANIQLEESVKILLPFILVLLVVAVAILFIPGLVLWVNNLVF
ncbi:DctM9 protein [Candidatus Vecturithrix granuli]|uniref:DctM9 protein n=1 Tax=Vecturithrix granuli TaxID=1499967 RepID=A0A081C9R6_VECG1|nr:DctM9 protein [Candidatus Vecturithrix granuli]